jgi:hypothetical protein
MRLQASGSIGERQRAKPEHIRDNRMTIGAANLPELVPTKLSLSTRLAHFAEEPSSCYRKQRIDVFC